MRGPWRWLSAAFAAALCLSTAAAAPPTYQGTQAIPVICVDQNGNYTGCSSTGGTGSANQYPGADYAKDGADGSGITPPTGGSGIRGWLSGIYKAVTSTLATSDANTGAASSSAGTASSKMLGVQGSDGNPLAKDATVAKDGADGSGITPPTGGSGIRGWLSGIYKAVTSTLATSANQSNEITQLTNIATRSVTFSEASKAAYTASSTNITTTRTVPAGYSRISYTAGCSQSATINVLGTNNGFTSYVVVGIATIPAGSDSPTISASSPIGPTISATATFSAYAAQIVMGTTAGTCTVSSSQTAS